MPEPALTDPSLLALVHEGWDHLKRQRPIAAWASWQRALRIEPEQAAATHALHVLANAQDLPLSARVEYRFLTPIQETDRIRWDARFRGRDMGQLPIAAETFGLLAEDNPNDSHARFNQGLCLAWLGRNAEAVACLGQAVDSMAEREPDLAVDTWTLAEILRQGGGAETLADDLNHVVQLTWNANSNDDPADFLDVRADVRAISNPVDPVTGNPRLSEARLYEWLDRPWPVEPTSALATVDDLRRVRATVVRLPGSLRLSGTDPVLLDEVVAEVAEEADGRIAQVTREATPRPLAFLDASVWSIRMPPGLDEETQGRLNRSVVERYYETVWLHRPRKGLDGRSPIEAGRAATEGDPIARAKLAAVVRLREQLGIRPATALLYQGYPFDRLRRRLALPATDPEAIDPLDPSSMSGDELDKLEFAELDDFALIEAYESAAALGQDARTARFANLLITRDPAHLARLDIQGLFATMVRHELAEDSPTGALARIDQAQAIDQSLTGGKNRQTYEVWRAEVFVRVGQADDAVRVTQALLEATPDPWLAIDAAETLLDAGFEEQGQLIARKALDLADANANADEVIGRAQALLIGED